MATGDAAAAAGFPLVEYSGADPSAQVRNGGEEINRTRDIVAELKSGLHSAIGVLPVVNGGTGATNKASARSQLGITSSTAVPANSVGSDGDIHFVIVG